MNLLIKNGRVINPATNTDDLLDILICDGKIKKIGKDILEKAKIINATGFIVAPGLVDMHVHLRDPGYTHKEDIISGAEAAAAGGFTTVCCMANTLPVCDNADIVKYIVNKAKDAPVNVHPVGAMTVGLLGEVPADYREMKKAGIVAVSDDGKGVSDNEVMTEVLNNAKHYKLPVICHCEDEVLAKGGCVNEGAVSKKLKLKGIPKHAEEAMTARDILLSAQTGVPVHIAHVSTSRSVGLIKAAKNVGIKVTCESAPHYFWLTDEACLKYGTNAKMNPPLRNSEDVEAIVQGLCDGTIDCIATDHAPHHKEEKERAFNMAPNGIVGLETSLSLTLTKFYHEKKMTLMQIIEKMSVNPAKILGLKAGNISEKLPADIVIFDPYTKTKVDPEKFKSKGKNTPFAGMELMGVVKYTIVGGKVVYRRGV